MGLRETLFGSNPSERKAPGALGAMLSMINLGSPVYTKRDYATLATHGFEKNVYVYRGVMLVSQALAGIPLYAHERKDSKAKVGDDHPLLQLLEKPNPEQGYGEWCTAEFAFLLNAGNSYTEGLAPLTGPNAGRPKELWTLRPDRMKILPDRKKRIGGYRYEVGNDRTDYKLQEIMHLKLFAATDDWYGLSPVAVAATIIDQMNSGNDWNTALLQNYARPPGALVAKGVLSDEQFSKLDEQITSRWSGVRNARRPFLLEGGLEWQDFANTPSEMDWLSGKAAAGRDIAIGMGIPSELLGDSANKTYSNVQEAWKHLYKDLCLPLLDMYIYKLNMWLTPRFDTGIKLAFDPEQIEALQEDQAAKITRLAAAHWMSVDEKREATGKPLLGGKEGEAILVPSSMINLTDLVNPVAMPADDEPDDQLDDEEGGTTPEPDTKLPELDEED